MAWRALIAALLVPALGAGVAIGVLHAMAAYTGAGLGDVLRACAPDQLVPFLSQECQPVQAHYWLIAFSGAVGVGGLGLLLLRLVAGRTDWSVFSFRGLLAALVVCGQWLVLVGAAYVAAQQWLPETSSLTIIAVAAPAGVLLVWVIMSALRLHGDR